MQAQKSNLFINKIENGRGNPKKVKGKKDDEHTHK